LVGVLLLAGCSPGRIHITKEENAVGLPRPAVIYVYPFAVDPSEVRVDPGGPVERMLNRLGGSGSDQDDQEVALGHQIADRTADALVQKITAMGLTAQRMSRSEIPPVDAIAVAGQFADVDEGNRLRRIAIGFHQGQSRVAAQVQLYRVTGGASAAQLLDFTAVAESAPLPGAAVTMGAGAAVQVAGAAAAAKEMGSTVQADADRLSDRIANSLQTFFARQGWTAPPSSFPPL